MHALIVQPDGRALVLRSTRMRRLLSDGRPDSSFGSDGAVDLPFLAGAAVLASDGRIVVTGTEYPAPEDLVIAVVALKPEGQGGNPWAFEGSVFALKLPTASAPGLACPPDARPLYRAYNNGMSGAPNHRYVTEGATLDEMIAQGWIMEGDGASRIFACVPLQP